MQEVVVKPAKREPGLLSRATLAFGRGDQALLVQGFALGLMAGCGVMLMAFSLGVAIGLSAGELFPI